MSLSRVRACGSRGWRGIGFGLVEESRLDLVRRPGLTLAGHRMQLCRDLLKDATRDLPQIGSCDRTQRFHHAGKNKSMTGSFRE